MSGGEEQCFENPTAPRGDDPTANEMTLSLRLSARGVAPKADLIAAEAAEAQRSYGHFPEEGEQLDTRPGHLLVVCGDWLTYEDGISSGGGDMTTGNCNADSLPELVCEGLTAALEAVSDRCVACTGGTGLSHAMVSRFVAGVGLEHCGPGQSAPLPCDHACNTMRTYHASSHRGCTDQGRENAEGAERRVGVALDSALMCDRLA